MAMFPVMGALIGGAVAGPVGLLAGAKIAGLAGVVGGGMGQYLSCTADRPTPSPSPLVRLYDSFNAALSLERYFWGLRFQDGREGGGTIPNTTLSPLE